MRAAIFVLLAACGGHAGARDAPETIPDGPVAPPPDAPDVVRDAPTTLDAKETIADAPTPRLHVIMNGCGHCIKNYLVGPDTKPICDCYSINEGETCDIPVPSSGVIEFSWEGMFCSNEFCHVSSATGCSLDGPGGFGRCAVWGDAGTVTLNFEFGGDPFPCPIDAG
jgi:hypothetical protein